MFVLPYCWGQGNQIKGASDEKASVLKQDFRGFYIPEGGPKSGRRKPTAAFIGLIRNDEIETF